MAEKPKKSLFVVDMLKDFMSKQVYPKAKLPVEPSKEIIDSVKKAIEYARRKGIPIFYLNDSHDEDDPEFQEWPKHCVKGTEGAEVIDELKPRPEDYIIKKRTYDGFTNPNLERSLHELGVREIYETGVVADICILETGKSALRKGYSVSVIKECVSGLKSQEEGLEELEKAGIEIITLEELIKLI